jgi:hypothetical protein
MLSKTCNILFCCRVLILADIRVQLHTVDQHSPGASHREWDGIPFFISHSDSFLDHSASANLQRTPGILRRDSSHQELR